MFWPPVTGLSRVLIQKKFNLTFQYTNEGYKQNGIWNTTGRNLLFKKNEIIQNKDKYID